MSKDNGCWCTFRFHLPGEKKKHLLAKQASDKLLKLAKELESRGRDRNR